MVMNRGELELLIEQYMHREDLDANIPGFIDLATIRIARDLRSAVNESVLDPYNAVYPEVIDTPLVYTSWVEFGGAGSQNGAAIDLARNGDESTQLRKLSAVPLVPGSTYRMESTFSAISNSFTIQIENQQIDCPGNCITDFLYTGAGGLINIDIGASGAINATATMTGLTLKQYKPGVAPLPDNFQSIKDISYMNGANRVVLSSSSPGHMSQFRQEGSRPAFYRVIGKEIEITPFQEKPFRLVYFNAPAALVNRNAENAVLDAYPMIYLYASMIEAFFFTQDAGGHTLAVETYTSEVAAENKRTESADMGDRPSIQGG